MNGNTLPWTKEYRITGVPETLRPYPERPVHDILYEAAKKFRKNGLIQFDKMMTYPEVREKVDRFATALVRLGLKKGDRVATILPTSVQFVLADYAISRAGLVHIPSSSLEPLTTLEYKFREGAPGALVTLDWHADIAERVARKCKISHLILCRLDDYSGEIATGVMGKLPAGAVWMKDMIESTPPSPPDIDYDVENDVETLIFTGGTTGLAKGCMLTHRNIYANALQNVHSLGKAGALLRGAATDLLGLPFFHSYGHVIMHTITLFGHNQILIPDPRDTRGMIRTIKKHYPVIKIGVPTQFMQISEELTGYGMLGVSGSAPLPASTQERYEKKAGGGIMEGYGLSEMSPCTHLNTTFLVRVFGGRAVTRLNTMFLNLPGVLPLLNGALRLLPRRVLGMILSRLFYILGRLTGSKQPAKGEADSGAAEKRGTIGIPFPDTEVKFLSVETGEEIGIDEMARGARGEMLLRGPQRMKGYWPQAGSGVDDEGFIHTSDVVRIDERGFFYIVDRTKDMIIVSGYKVYSREVDDILYRHPKVQMAATIGVPDPEREGSERIVVYVQPKERHRRDVSEKEIIDFLKKQVAKYAVPKKVVLIDAMPLTEVQKVDKKALREMEAGGAARGTAAPKAKKKQKAKAKGKAGKK